jgi:hypothetical protein
MVNAQNMIKQARHVLASNVQAELGGLTTMDTPSVAIESTGNYKAVQGNNNSIRNASYESSSLLESRRFILKTSPVLHRVMIDDPSPSHDVAYDGNKDVQGNSVQLPMDRYPL